MARCPKCDQTMVKESAFSKLEICIFCYPTRPTDIEIPAPPKKKCPACGRRMISVGGAWQCEYCEGIYTFDDEKPKKDAVNPDHYNGTECLEAIAAATKNLSGYEAFCTGNAIKYLWRWKQKGGVEDLDKAIRYIELLKSGTEQTR